MGPPRPAAKASCEVVLAARPAVRDAGAPAGAAEAALSRPICRSWPSIAIVCDTKVGAMFQNGTLKNVNMC